MGRMGAFGNWAFSEGDCNKWRFGDSGARGGEREEDSVGIGRNNPNLRSSVLKLGWDAFGNGSEVVLLETLRKENPTDLYESL